MATVCPTVRPGSPAEGFVRELIRPRYERTDEGLIPGPAEGFVRELIRPRYERTDEGLIPGPAEGFVRELIRPRYEWAVERRLGGGNSVCLRRRLGA
jgi:hypothetical protein